MSEQCEGACEYMCRENEGPEGHEGLLLCPEDCPSGDCAYSGIHVTLSVSFSLSISLTCSTSFPQSHFFSLSPSSANLFFVSL